MQQLTEEDPIIDLMMGSSSVCSIMHVRASRPSPTLCYSLAYERGGAGRRDLLRDLVGLVGSPLSSAGSSPAETPDFIGMAGMQ